MPITGAPMHVDTPTFVAPKGGLFGVATIIDDPDPHLGLGAEYETDVAGSAQVLTDNCTTEFPATPCNPDGDPDLLTATTQVSVEGDSFVVTTLIACNPIGTTPERMRERAAAALAMREQRAVEAYLQSLLLATTTDLTPGGGAPTIDVGVGLLEEWIGANYSGLGLLHMGRRATTCAITRRAAFPGDSGAVATGQGTPIANGTGYSGLVLAVSGQVTLRRGPVIVAYAPPMPLYTVTIDAVDEDRCAPARATARRTYVPLIDGAAAKITVTC